ncbi:MAG: 4-alpha-glucanotransferase [Porphyromonas sp.]|nr:4-alpha-glucanotransferase [Porphyromonas sp.]
MLTLRFRIPYRTDDTDTYLQWQGVIDGRMTRLVMRSDPSSDLWYAEWSAAECEVVELSYNYRVWRRGQLLRVEPPSLPHTFRVSAADVRADKVVEIYDLWVEASPQHRYSQAPLSRLMGRTDLRKYRLPSIASDANDTFLLHSAVPYEGQLFLVGAHPSIGGWDVEKGRPLVLSRCGYMLQFPERVATEYKIILKCPTGDVIWEEGANRHYIPDPDGHTIYGELPAPRWTSYRTEKPAPLTGTAVPLFALRGKRTHGVGDFGAAVELLNWMHRNHQSVLQLLPIYDTTFTRSEKDSYPYNAISTFGLHPIYMDLTQLPGYREAPEREAWEERGRRLDERPAVDYCGVMAHKMEVIELLFERWSDEHRDDRPFVDFYTKMGEQLLPYALFCTIRDLYPGRAVADYPLYGEALHEWSASRTHGGRDIQQRVMLYAFIQYRLYKQLEHLKQKARHLHIIIKGDLPIGVSRNSVDVWQAPHLFCLDKEAGSPPDAFSATGQDWGFPTYNWEEMERDHFAWWRRRLQTMALHFDALRIDHILGFFRIWSIPLGTGDASTGWYVPAQGYTEEEVNGVQQYCNKDESGRYHPPLEPHKRVGFERLPAEAQQQLCQLSQEYYYHRNEDLWRSTALKRLSAIVSAAPILLCGEDLGVIPKTVKEVLESLEILSLEVLRMPKLLGRDFVRPEDIPELSVFTTSTHDMASLRGWWSQLATDRKEAIAQVYHFEGDPTPKGLVAALLRLQSPSMLILPLQDWFVLTGFGADVPAEDEQINHPEDPNQVWNYRLPRSQSGNSMMR